MGESVVTPRTLKGTRGSPGIAIGLAYVVDRGKIKVPMRLIMPKLVPFEKARFRTSIHTSLRQLETALDREIGDDHKEILDAHLAWLSDEYMIREVETLIESERINAEWAVKKLLDQLIASIDAGTESERQARSDLFHEVGDRIIRNLMGAQQESVETVPEGVILVAHDFTPADMAHVDRTRVAGMAMDIGGPTSHTCILARGMELPTIVGLDHVSNEVQTGDVLVLDADDGRVYVNPPLAVLDDYQERARRLDEQLQELLKLKDVECKTADGVSIQLQANIELLEELGIMEEHGIKDIGLFRSEFLFLMKGGAADEDEQYELYSLLLRNLGPEHCVTIRTLDLGWDKVYAGMDMQPETNPAMGLRAIRFCLDREDLFKDQLRALLRASIHGRMRIMFPMISGIDELREAKNILEEVQQELELEGAAYSDNVEIGIMIEVPSAVMMADILADEADFFSIGTNDLIQYSLAIDRENEHVAHLYTPAHVAILRMIESTVKAGRAAGIEVAMCGEMAGDIQMTMLLLGLGVTCFSANPPAALKVKQLIRKIDTAEARNFAKRVMALSSSEDIANFIRREMNKRYPEIFANHNWTI
ncbi:MAG: phosphoenolpyruvate--protein phosphotransferase [Deltaproteobacteria bacterium]|nr:phosphoenolpyruvate--protein phosphotransferase [Deltaproteobacteria bacterium]MCB9489056.1 phosphoenolpyruvate--protein phosphotransferase [Deltaproteobacteria bacterium]